MQKQWPHCWDAVCGHQLNHFFVVIRQSRVDARQSAKVAQGFVGGEDLVIQFRLVTWNRKRCYDFLVGDKNGDKPS